MQVWLSHPDVGVSKSVKVGWSWTVFLFGPIALAVRGQWLHAIIYIAAVLLTMGFAAPVLWFVYGAMANKLLATQLMLKNGMQFDTGNNPADVRFAAVKPHSLVPHRHIVSGTGGLMFSA